MLYGHYIYIMKYKFTHQKLETEKGQSFKIVNILFHVNFIFFS